MRRTFAFASLLLACGSNSPPPAPLPPVTSARPAEPVPKTSNDRELRYSVVVMSRPAGGSVTKVRADGTRETSYAFIDNGRGPKVEARLRADANGLLSSFEADGVETMGTPINERFAFEGAHAKWKNQAEKGEKDAKGAFYVPISPYPEALGMLVRALRANGNKLALLPEGEARLEKTADAEVTSESGKKHITGWAITGLEVLPTRVWTNDDGELFGTVDAWWSFIEKGFEANIDRLIAIQKALDEKREEDLALKATKKQPEAGLAITHVRLFDADAKKWKDDQTIVLKGDKIVAVGPAASTKPPANAEVIDGKGKAALPGLWDMHAHLGFGDGELHIAGGVTTARDLGNDPDRLDNFKARYDGGKAIGPKVLRAGFIEGRGEKAAGSKITAETEAEAIDAVKFYSGRGYEQIKIYNSMKPELVPILAREAHAKGMRVSGHVPVHMRAEEAVRAGYDEIQHVNMLFLNFFVDRDTDTRTTLRFSLVADKAPMLDLASAPVKDFVKLLVEKKTVIDPTLAVFEDLFTARLGEMRPLFKPIADRLPVQVRRGGLTGGLVVPEGKDAHYRAAHERALQLVKNMHSAGVPVICGTDGFPGFTLHRELELHAKAGIPVNDVLFNATLGSARVMKKDKVTGSIATGKEADIILVDGDPGGHIEDIRKVSLVVRGGRVHLPADIYPAMGIKP